MTVTLGASERAFLWSFLVSEATKQHLYRSSNNVKDSSSQWHPATTRRLCYPRSSAARSTGTAVRTRCLSPQQFSTTIRTKRCLPPNQDGISIQILPFSNGTGGIPRNQAQMSKQSERECHPSVWARARRLLNSRDLRPYLNSPFPIATNTMASIPKMMTGGGKSAQMAPASAMPQILL